MPEEDLSKLSLPEQYFVNFLTNLQGEYTEYFLDENPILTDGMFSVIEKYSKHGEDCINKVLNHIKKTVLEGNLKKVQGAVYMLQNLDYLIGEGESIESILDQVKIKSEDENFLNKISEDYIKALIEIDQKKEKNDKKSFN